MTAPTAADGAALLEAIKADPADDAVRLVFADWLEETGQEAPAYCIRDQVRRRPDENDTFTWGVVPPGWRINRSRHAAGGYMPGSWADWIARTLPAGGCEGVVCTSRRGLMAEIRCTLAQWLRHGPAIAAEQPLEYVTLTGVVPYRGADWYPSYGLEARGTVGWGWYSCNEVWIATSHLPPRLWRAMRSPHAQDDAGGWKVFPSERQAIDALSAACIAWARLPAEER